MPVIAMTREMGSLGKEVAEGVARELGLTCVYEEVVSGLADEMRLSRDTVAGIVEGRTGRLQRWRSLPARTDVHARALLLETALEGDVLIRGWGAPFLFRPIRHIPCVRVCAPFEWRVANLMRMLGTSRRQEIEREIGRSDRAYGASLRMSRRANADAPWYFDLILNTERESIGNCVREIVRLTKRPEFQETQDSRGLLEQKALQARIKAALRGSPQTAAARITIEIEKDAIRLSGMVDDDAQRGAIGQIVRALAGIRSVQCSLRSIKGGVRHSRIASNF